MRHTALSRGAERLVLRTGDAGTELTDAAGLSLGQHGTDRHDELLERLAGQGWTVAEEAQIRPPEAAADRAPPGAGLADGGARTDPAPPG